MTNYDFSAYYNYTEIYDYNVFRYIIRINTCIGVPLPKTLKCGTIQVGMLLPKTLKCRKMRNIIFNEKNDKGM